MKTKQENIREKRRKTPKSVAVIILRLSFRLKVMVKADKYSFRIMKQSVNFSAQVMPFKKKAG